MGLMYIDFRHAQLVTTNMGATNMLVIQRQPEAYLVVVQRGWVSLGLSNTDNNRTVPENVLLGCDLNCTHCESSERLLDP